VFGVLGVDGSVAFDEVLGTRRSSGHSMDVGLGLPVVIVGLCFWKRTSFCDRALHCMFRCWTWLPHRRGILVEVMSAWWLGMWSSARQVVGFIKLG
jgi:hypothetical protein